jgi:hypothetical protein
MAIVNIPVVQIDRSIAANKKLGTLGTEVAGDVTNFNSFLNGPQTFLIVRNTTAGALSFTVEIAKTIPEGTVAAVAKSVGASFQIILGPFPPDIFNQADQTVLLKPATGLSFQAFTL